MNAGFLNRQRHTLDLPPTQDASHHQVYYNFRQPGILTEPSFVTIVSLCRDLNPKTYVFFASEIPVGHLGCIPKPVVNMDVSENSGTPKSSILRGFSIIFTIHFWVPQFLETPILEESYQPPKQLVEFESPNFSDFSNFGPPWWIKMQDFGENFPHVWNEKLDGRKVGGIFFPSSQKRPKHILILNKTCHDFLQNHRYHQTKRMLSLSCWNSGYAVMVFFFWNHQNRRDPRGDVGANWTFFSRHHDTFFPLSSGMLKVRNPPKENRILGFLGFVNPEFVVEIQMAGLKAKTLDSWKFSLKRFLFQLVRS